MIAVALLHLLLSAVGLVVLVAPLAVYAARELSPASQPRPAFAGIGGAR